MIISSIFIIPPSQLSILAAVTPFARAACRRRRTGMLQNGQNPRGKGASAWGGLCARTNGRGRDVEDRECEACRAGVWRVERLAMVQVGIDYYRERTNSFIAVPSRWECLWVSECFNATGHGPLTNGGTARPGRTTSEPSDWFQELLKTSTTPPLRSLLCGITTVLLHRTRTAWSRTRAPC